MNAILINPFTRAITEIETSAELEDLYRHLGCQYVEAISFDERHTLWLDEEGLLVNGTDAASGEPTQRHFIFNGPRGLQLIAGRALILGTTEDGGDTSVMLTKQQLEARVSFPLNVGDAAALAERMKRDIFVIFDDAERRRAEDTLKQRQQEILSLLGSD